MASGKIVVALTGNTTGHTNIINNPAYAVVGYNPSSTLPFTVYNPWGLTGGNTGGRYIWGQFNANGAAMKAHFWATSRTNAAPDAAPGMANVTQAMSTQEFVVSMPSSFSFQVQVTVAQNVSVQTPFVSDAGFATSGVNQPATIASSSQNGPVSQAALDTLWASGNLSGLVDTLVV